MRSYKIIIEEKPDNKAARELKQILEDEDESTVASINGKRGIITVDTEMSVESLFEIIEEAGYTPVELELL